MRSTMNGGGNIIRDGLVLYVDAANTKSYPGTNNDWFDLTKNSINGVATNGPTFDSSNFGSFIFDGNDDFIQFGQVENLKFTNSQPHTISAWVYWTPTAGTLTTIVSFGNVSGAFPGVGDEGYYLSLDSGVLGVDSFLFDYYDGSNPVNAISIVGNNNTVPTNTWFNIAATNNGSNTAAGLKVYINGSLSQWTTRIDQPTLSIDYSNSNFNIGARDATSTINGKISSTLVYNRVLTASEIEQNFLAIKSRY
jgi:hypothetical protein